MVSRTMIYVVAPVVVEVGVRIGRHLYVTRDALRGNLRMAANFVVLDAERHPGLEFRQVPCPSGLVTAPAADACDAILSGEYHALEGLVRAGGSGWPPGPVLARLLGKKYVAFRRETGAAISVRGVERLEELRRWVG